MLLTFIISIIAFILVYFILLLSTRLIFKNLSDKKYQIMQSKLKIPIFLFLLNIALLMPFQFYEEFNIVMENIQHLFWSSVG